MPMRKQSIEFDRPDPTNRPTFVVASTGNEGIEFDVSELKALWQGRNSPEFLLHQMIIALLESGVNPNTATPAQIRSAIRAAQYWWSN